MRAAASPAPGPADRPRADRPHSEAAGHVVARLGVDPARGLSAADAEARLARDGPNELPKARREHAVRQLLAQLASPIVLTLLAAAGIALVDGASRHGASFAARYGDALAIFLIVALNALLGFVQERRAEAALDALEKMQTANARVRRDGHVEVVAAARVVVGDVLEIEAGDAVAADARLLESVDLAAEESALTGESEPSVKDARAAPPEDAALADRPTMLLSGTTVVRGKGRAVVVATGPRTELGRISALMQRPREHSTPLEERLESFGRRVLWGCLALAALLFARGLIRGDRTWHALLLEAVSLAVAAIPEGLPAITTITLALGMQRMARKGALVRKLAAVETLGAATVICTDKTGTLTHNEMSVRRVVAGLAPLRVTGGGYEPRGEILDEQGRPADASRGALHDLLVSAALCNDATLRREDGRWKVHGDPTEGALLALAAKGGVSREDLARTNRVVRELPFDSDRKRMSVVADDASGRRLVHSKGSPEGMLARCEAYETPAGRVALDAAARRAWLEESERMSGDALRVLALARRDLPTGADPGGDVETGLTLLGLVGMIDPPRESAKAAVATCAAAGVRAVMITGDHKLTAIAIARELGIWRDGAAALTGAELDRLSDADLDAMIDQARVFARVSAEQKLRIVGAFKRRGHVVAMTGDGVNDAPALREAHIGVAMGLGGTDVARGAADMVIADDNFATIVDAVREGRAIWRNIQKSVYFLLSSNAGLMVAVFAASFVDGLEPLTPLMILWINLVTNGLPALALGVDPPDASQMREPPRPRAAGLLGARDWGGIAFVGAWMGAAAIVCDLWPFERHDAAAMDHGRAMAFSLLALSPLLHVVNCRSPTVSFLALRPVLPRALVAAVLVSAAIHLVAVLVPTLRPVFRTFPMDAREWALLLSLSASVVPAVEAMKLLRRALAGAFGGRA